MLFVSSLNSFNLPVGMRLYIYIYFRAGGQVGRTHASAARIIFSRRPDQVSNGLRATQIETQKRLTWPNTTFFNFAECQTKEEFYLQGLRLSQMGEGKKRTLGRRLTCDLCREGKPSALSRLIRAHTGLRTGLAGRHQRGGRHVPGRLLPQGARAGGVHHAGHCLSCEWLRMAVRFKISNIAKAKSCPRDPRASHETSGSHSEDLLHSPAPQSTSRLQG